MSVFELALEKLLVSEGGYVNDASDPGGATNMGITLGTLQNTRDYEVGDVDGDGDIDIDDIKNMDEEHASEFYKKYFWDKQNLDMFPPKVAYLMFDFSVNSGFSRAGKTLQKALNTMGCKLTEDGDVGQNTINAMESSSPDILVGYMLQERRSFYKRLVDKNPTLQKFFKGWMNRVDRLEQDVEEF